MFVQCESEDGVDGVEVDVDLVGVLVPVGEAVVSSAPVDGGVDEVEAAAGEPLAALFAAALSCFFSVILAKCLQICSLLPSVRSGNGKLM